MSTVEDVLRKMHSELAKENPMESSKVGCFINCKSAKQVVVVNRLDSVGYFYVPHKNVSLRRRHLHCRLRATKLRSILSAFRRP
jgi:hypothetical protein